MESDFKASLIRSYDNDAPARDERTLPGERVRLRQQFVALLRTENRTKLIEFGAGAGQDAAELVAAGLDVVAMDLSPENVARCRARGIDARVGDFYALDFPDGSFEAGWAMSTLLHVPNDDIDQILAELIRVLEPGAPLAIGLWGGIDEEGVLDDDWADPPRFFSMRTDSHLREILERSLVIEASETALHSDDGSTHYQWCVVRAPAS